MVGVVKWDENLEPLLPFASGLLDVEHLERADREIREIELGAPNISDAIWLYGGDEAALTETITNARFGVMPAWGQRLSEADVRAVSIYVHSLGGGE